MIRTRLTVRTQPSLPLESTLRTSPSVPSRGKAVDLRGWGPA